MPKDPHKTKQNNTPGLATIMMTINLKHRILFLRGREIEDLAKREKPVRVKQQS